MFVAIKISSRRTFKMAVNNMKEAMVILENNNRKVQYPAGCCLNDLIKAVEEKFSDVLAENQRVFFLQQWDNDYKEYEDICEEQPDIPHKSKIMVS